MLKKIFTLFIVVNTIVSVCIFISCNNTGDKRKTEPDRVASDSIDVILKGKLELIIFNMPPPVEIINSLYETGASYNKDILIHSVDANKYISRSSKAINLGILGSDITYSIRYEKTQEALILLKTAIQLADELGVPHNFDNNLMVSYNSNIDNKDSLINIVYNVYDELEKSLKNNEQLETAALVLTGSWLEGLYLSTINFQIDKKEDAQNIKLRKRIRQHHYNLPAIIELFTGFENKSSDDWESSDDSSEIISKLKKIDDFYNSLPDKETMNDEEINKLSEILTEVRNGVTEM